MVESEPKLFLIQGDVYEVEKLVAVKIVKGKKLYRVRWRGYSRDSDTLEPEENLLSCKDMIEDLERKLKEKHAKKKKQPLKPEPFTKELRSATMSMPCESTTLSESTWQATEVQPGNNSKDTFWRDFDEGKISGAVYDKDMYSKVKERAERAARTCPSDGGKLSDGGNPPKENPGPPLCPKVVLKRKPIDRPCESLTYKSTFKVKPMGLYVKKRKRYDVLRDYRKRKSRVHRKRKLDENGRRKLAFRSADQHNPEVQPANGSNILQELLINDEPKGPNLPGYVMAVPSLDTGTSKMKMKIVKDTSGCEEAKGSERKVHPLMCRISLQDKCIASSTAEGKPVHKTSMDPTLYKVFSSMIDAVANDRLDKVERLCGNNFLVNCSQEDGTTALMVAAQLGRYHMTKLLLKANAHKDRQNKKGETALMMACKNGHSLIAKLLLEHGANFSLTNAAGSNVLRIANQFTPHSDIPSILVDHIVRVVSEFEKSARSRVKPIAQIKHALFPIQCFSLNEGPHFSLHFHHHVKLESPEKNGNQNLFFIARSSIKTTSVQCQFDANSLVQNISINGVKQDVFDLDENTSSVYKVMGLQNGSNKVSITTGHYPESQIKLIVCAYKVHRSGICFPTQKIKSE